MVEHFKCREIHNIMFNAVQFEFRCESLDWFQFVWHHFQFVECTCFHIPIVNENHSHRCVRQMLQDQCTLIEIEFSQYQWSNLRQTCQCVCIFCIPNGIAIESSKCNIIIGGGRAQKYQTIIQHCRNFDCIFDFMSFNVRYQWLILDLFAICIGIFACRCMAFQWALWLLTVFAIFISGAWAICTVFDVRNEMRIVAKRFLMQIICDESKVYRIFFQCHFT